jgi:uncharacterized protein (TIGR04206 family)
VATSTPRRRLLALLAVAVVPWTVVFIGNEVTMLFPFGVFNSNPPELADLYTLLSYGWRLPRNPELLPLSYTFYALALACVGAGVLREGLEPERLTAGLLVLAGVTHVGVAYSVAYRLQWTPVPVGSLLLLATAWWYYWEDLRTLVVSPRRDLE